MSTLPLTRSPYRQQYFASTMRPRRRMRGMGGMRAVSLNWEVFFGPTTIIVALIIVAVVMSFLYLLHFNQVATKGYDLKRLDVDRQQLLDQYQIANLNVSKVKSMDTILKSGRIQRMVRANNITFVRGDTALASANVGL